MIQRHFILPFVVMIFTAFSINFNSFASEYKKSEKIEVEKSKKIEVEAEDEGHHPSPPHGGPILGSSINRHSLGLGIGQTTLKHGFKYNGNDKITVDAFYAYVASYSFDLLVNAHTSKHEQKGKWVKLASGNVAIKGKFFHYDSFTPYVFGGLGFYRPQEYRYVGTQLLESNARWVFGLTAGLGVDLHLNKNVSLGFMGVFHNPAKVQQEIGPDVNGSYYKLLITGFYTFD
ncbi:MAG: hypothetical protein WCG27_00675 [Pseudomonadota bacterium]